MKATLRDWFLLCSLGLIWGLSFMFTTVATADFGVLTLAAGRVAIGAVALVLVLLWRREWLPGFSGRTERLFWAFALGSAMVTNAIPFTLLSYAQRHVDSSFAGVSVAIVPLFVLPLAHFLVPGERMTLRRILGFILGFVGIIVLMGPDAFANLGGDITIILAQLACVGTAFCYASGSIVAKRAPQLGLIRFGTASLILAACVSLPVALMVEGVPSASPSTNGLIALIYLGLVPTGLAMVMLLTVIASAGPSFLSLVNYQVPVWAVVFGILVLGESPSPRLGVAVLLIFAGLAISQGIVGLRRGGHARG